MRYKFSIIIGLSILASSSLALAVPRSLPVARDGEVIDSVGSGAIDAILPEIQTEGGITYITGGIGDEELAEINARESDFNTHLLLKAKNGEYMGEVDLRFFDTKGVEVFAVEDVGPYFYVNLPVGKYSVEATSQKGTVKKAKVNASAKLTKGQVHIIFNE